MAEGVYLLCMLTSAGCALALMRTYVRRRSRILLWSSLCFGGLAVNNALLVIDLMVLPAVDLAIVRAAIAAASVVILVVGLVWDVE